MKCQVQSYLHMSNRDNAFLVEVLKRRGGHNSDFNIIPIEKDPNYYQDNVGILSWISLWVLCQT